jgi:hypothetical protein
MQAGAAAAQRGGAGMAPDKRRRDEEQQQPQAKRLAYLGVGGATGVAGAVMPGGMWAAAAPLSARAVQPAITTNQQQRQQPQPPAPQAQRAATSAQPPAPQAQRAASSLLMSHSSARQVGAGSAAAGQGWQDEGGLLRAAHGQAYHAAADEEAQERRDMEQLHDSWAEQAMMFGLSSGP